MTWPEDFTPELYLWLMDRAGRRARANGLSQLAAEEVVGAAVDLAIDKWTDYDASRAGTTRKAWLEKSIIPTALTNRRRSGIDDTQRLDEPIGDGDDYTGAEGEALTLADVMADRIEAFDPLASVNYTGVVAERAVEMEEARAETGAILASLALQSREVLILRYIHGLTYEQMAERLGISTSAVRKRHERALMYARRAPDTERAVA